MTNKKTILLVDDEPEVRESLGRVLALEQYEVTGVASKAEAMSRLANAAYDGILLDVNLPDGSGWDLYRKMRQEQSDLPIVVISARPQDENADALDALGVWMPKPLDLTELLMKLGKMVSSRGKVEVQPCTVA
jgi:DNA-binding response OmpR family regulator